MAVNRMRMYGIAKTRTDCLLFLAREIATFEGPTPAASSTNLHQRTAPMFRKCLPVKSHFLGCSKSGLQPPPPPGRRCAGTPKKAFFCPQGMTESQPFSPPPRRLPTKCPWRRRSEYLPNIIGDGPKPGLRTDYLFDKGATVEGVQGKTRRRTESCRRSRFRPGPAGQPPPQNYASLVVTPG